MTDSIAEVADSDDRDFDYDEHDCANCGGEGFTYGCSWDWQCPTYDEGGTCLCMRHCEWCQPRPRNPELDAVLAAPLSTPTADRTSKENGNGDF